ncbi:IclR family transcriptional regulator [Planococcus sp. CAU13]|uniref:IclR family transcriptional regulator n=1 Tax=Planococcus sp. CAU13 TaxID=1541197 RepID=UPI00053000B1|nr:IclR family transcriptional regulator [Planococcus sp. CAU13]
MASNEVTTLKKGLSVLELVKQNQGITLKEVMNSLDLTKSTAFRMLTTLEDMKYIYKIHTHFFVNPKKFPTAIDKSSSIDWTSLRSIYQASQSLEMNTYFGDIEGTDVIYTRIPNEQPKMGIDKKIGNRVKVHQSALGKIILAHLEEEQLLTLFGRMSLEPATNNTFQDPQLFYYHLKAIRQDGYAFDDEEHIVGIRCVAVPVFYQNKVMGALSVVAPLEQIPRSSIKTIFQKLTLNSKAITKELEFLETHIQIQQHPNYAEN